MDNPVIRISNVDCYYGESHAVKNVSLDIPDCSIYAFIGPSGCGKTTLLRSLNRLNDLIPSFRLTGDVEMRGNNIYKNNSADYVMKLRRGVGMIFQQPNPLPTSILKNMVLPLKEHIVNSNKFYYDKAVEKLKIAALYDEVAERLKKTALSLSGGQQ